jgi:hypothetical protein
MHMAGDLIRISTGASLDSTGIARALVFSSQYAVPDPVPASWRETPKPAFPPFEDRPRGTLPVELGELSIAERSPTVVTATLRDVIVEVPRYWLARTLFRLGLHGLRLGYVEVYGGLVFDDHAATTHDVHVGVRSNDQRLQVSIPRTQAMGLIERLYRAVAPAGYTERLV